MRICEYRNLQISCRKVLYVVWEFVNTGIRRHQAEKSYILYGSYRLLFSAYNTLSASAMSAFRSTSGEAFATPMLTVSS